jgi:two-component system sensor histidine kinase KdpD
MSAEMVDLNQDDHSGRPRPQATALHPALGYVAGLAAVLVAAGVAFVVENIVPSADLTLVFVLPVLLIALNFGWAPALVSTVAAVAAFDFFFTEPRFSLRVDSPADLWAMGLLLVVAAIASTVAARSRHNALQAQRAADRAEALRRLAHLVTEAASAKRLQSAAAEALETIFRGPAVVLVERDGHLDPAAKAGGPTPSSIDMDAAHWAWINRLATRAGTFPFDAATFDFWPIVHGDGEGVVLGLGPGSERPADTATYTETIGAYLLASLPRAAAPRRS